MRLRHLTRGETTEADLVAALDALGLTPGDGYVIAKAETLQENASKTNGLVCVDCGRTPEEGVTVWHEVIGWEKDRVAGGTNHVALRENTGRLMCHGCMTSRRSGISKDQEAMAL